MADALGPLLDRESPQFRAAVTNIIISCGYYPQNPAGMSSIGEFICTSGTQNKCVIAICTYASMSWSESCCMTSEHAAAVLPHVLNVGLRALASQ